METDEFDFDFAHGWQRFAQSQVFLVYAREKQGIRLK
jgi:hypothetical protein